MRSSHRFRPPPLVSRQDPPDFCSQDRPQLAASARWRGRAGGKTPVARKSGAGQRKTPPGGTSGVSGLASGSGVLAQVTLQIIVAGFRSRHFLGTAKPAPALTVCIPLHSSLVRHGMREALVPSTRAFPRRNPMSRSRFCKRRPRANRPHGGGR